MDISELQMIWQKQALQAPDVVRIALIVDTIGADDRKFRRMIWWRDFREIGVALALAVLLALSGRTGIRWIAVASVLFVAAYLLRSRLRKVKEAEPASLGEKLQQMIGEVKSQIRLLRSIVWWYLLPCAIAFAAVSVERLRFPMSWSRLCVTIGVGLSLGIAIYWLNQRTVRKTLEPRRRNLQRLLDELAAS
jgi:hypothetical protein